MSQQDKDQENKDLTKQVKSLTVSELIQRDIDEIDRNLKREFLPSVYNILKEKRRAYEFCLELVKPLEAERDLYKEKYENLTNLCKELIEELKDLTE